MKSWVRLSTTLFLILIVSRPLSFAAPNDIKDQTRQFLDAYAHGDLKMVLSMTAPTITVYGSDIDEVFTGKAGVKKMLQDDMKLWNGSAEIGEMQRVSVVEKGDFASIFFNATFRLQGRDPMPLRFAMVWQRSEKGWKLVQSSNVVPTQGQSAEKLLQRN